MPRLKLTEWTKKLFKGRKRDRNEDSASERVQNRMSAFQFFFETLRDSSDVCPPLKSVVGGLYRIIDVIEVCIMSTDSFILLTVSRGKWRITRQGRGLQIEQRICCRSSLARYVTRESLLNAWFMIGRYLAGAFTFADKILALQASTS